MCEDHNHVVRMSCAKETLESTRHIVNKLSTIKGKVGVASM